ncbi:MAG: AAA family ATPase [Bacteroidota bacterium]
MNLQQAQRQQAKIKMGLQGPSGSGKTYSALLIAYGLIGNWQKIAVIDSENNSAHLYAHLGPYNVLGISQPFAPEKYIEAIELCEQAGIQAIIIDSISHEWDGNGGILDIHGSMIGNSFTNWNKVTPRHNAFVQKILQSPAHIIATVRSKQDYVLSEKNGKVVPEKVGLKGVTRDGMDYEFTIVLDLDIKHNALASKDRTGLFMDKPTFIPDSSTGEKIQNWCQIRLSLDEVTDLIQGITKIEDLQNLYRKYPEYQQPLQEQFQQRKLLLQQPQIIH